MSANAAPRPATTGRIGYVLKVFPRVSETFVINEIRALEGLGEELAVFSLHHPPVPVRHGILRELRSPVTYVEDDLADDDATSSQRRRLEAALAIPAEQRAAVLPRKYVRLAAGLAEGARQAGVAHLHAHFASRAGHVAALAAALLGCSYSITAHAKDIYHAEVDRELLRWKLAGARVVVTVTDYNLRHLRDLVADLPGAAERIVRLYNGVDLERFRPEPPPAGRPLLLGIGRLVEKKGFAVLVEACRRLRERGYDFACEIIGDGPEQEALRAQIATGGLEATILLRGALASEQVASSLRGATLVVLPCVVARDGNVDALPTVLLEAMASGRPVISTRLSGIPEIVAEGETGLLVPPGDAGALAEALAALLDQPGMATAMGGAGRRRAERLFDLRANAAALRDLLRRPGAEVGH